MEKIEIYKFQLKAIANALRITANVNGCRTPNKTCFDRDVVQAEKYANNALAGNIDKRVNRYETSKSDVKNLKSDSSLFVKNDELNPNTMSFELQGEPILELRHNGDIYVKGKLADTDKDVVDALREYADFIKKSL